MASNVEFRANFFNRFDFAFDTNAEGAESQVLSDVVVGQDGRAIVKLYVFDFGGSTTVLLEQNGKIEAKMQLPFDTNNDGIADVWATNYDKVTNAFADLDEVGKPGDMIPAFDEYRGFVVQGKHVRTDPDVKTLFVWNRLGEIGIEEPFKLLSTPQFQVFEVLEGEFWTHEEGGHTTRIIANPYGKGIPIENDDIRRVFASVV